MDTDNNALLHCAAKMGNTGEVELLLGKGASIEAMNKDCNTLIHLAAQNRHSHLLQLLNKSGEPLVYENNAR